MRSSETWEININQLVAIQILLSRYGQNRFSLGLKNEIKMNRIEKERIESVYIIEEVLVGSIKKKKKKRRTDLCDCDLIVYAIHCERSGAVVKKNLNKIVYIPKS